MKSTPWPNIEDFDYSLLQKAEKYLPNGMKLITNCPCGVLENLTSLLGFENMCFMTIEDPELLHDICDAIGSRLVEHTKKYKG
ncbi:MAG: hypothetical protein U9O87_01350, partial [Verrucomicrobiota bacterium]|nr:hypothetical protein [Verrucomicrobiota bacterium]